jgi:CheY-like chemotaxis protein
MSSEASKQQRRKKFVPPLIFVVDDDPALTEMAEIVLKSEGFTTRVFTRPEEALRAIRAARRKPDLLLTDYDMGSMTGLELAEQSRRNIPALKTIVLSGTVQPSVVLRAAIRVNGFISKPYLPCNLIREIKSVLSE